MTGFDTALCLAKAIAVAIVDPGMVPLRSSSVVEIVGSCSSSELESLGKVSDCSGICDSGCCSRDIVLKVHHLQCLRKDRTLM